MVKYKGESYWSGIFDANNNSMKTSDVIALLNSIEEKDAEIERLKAERDQLTEEAVVKEENMEQAVSNIARLKSELAALQNEHSDGCFGLTKQLNEKDAEIANLKAEAAARPPAPKVEWVQEKNGNGNSTWTCVVEGATLHSLRASLRDDAVAWNWPGGNQTFTDLSAAKAAVEASLKPPSVRRWVSRDNQDGFEHLIFIWGEKSRLGEHGYYSEGPRDVPNDIDLEVAAAIGINLQPGQACLWDFTYRRVVERWES